MKSSLIWLAFDHVKTVSQNSNEQLPCAKESDVKVDKGSDCVLKPQTLRTKLEVLKTCTKNKRVLGAL